MPRVFRAAGWISGALCVIAALCWAISPWVDVLIWRTNPPHCYEVHSILGCIIAAEGGHGPHVGIRTGQFWRDPDWSWWFHYTRDDILIIPLWSIFLATGAASLSLVRAARSIAKRPGLCHSCGYDRRGLPPDSPCPECGSTSLPPAQPKPR
jgi:hypothetical protein